MAAPKKTTAVDSDDDDSNDCYDDEADDEQNSGKPTINKTLFRALVEATQKSSSAAADFSAKAIDVPFFSFKAMDVLRKAVDLHMQRLCADGQTIAVAVRKKKVVSPMDLRVGQSRGARGGLQKFLTRAEALEDEVHIGEFQQIGMKYMKKFCQSAGVRITTKPVVEEGRQALYRFMDLIVSKAMKQTVDHKRKRVSDTDVDTALKRCARSFM